MLNRNVNNRRKRKKILDVNDDEDELKRLEEIVLGDGENIFDEVSPKRTVAREESEKQNKVPAWIDEADTEPNGSMHLIGFRQKKLDAKFRESKFQEVLKKPKWANYSDDQKQSKTSKDDILMRCGNIITKSNILEAGTIEIKKLKDLNSETYSEGPITAVKFHKNSMVGMVAGLSGVVSLFQVDGKENTKLQSTKYHNFPIECASFVNNGEEYIIGTKYSKHFHVFNLMSGQSFKMSHKNIDGLPNLRKFTVSHDDKFIAAIGPKGKIYLLTAQTKECVDNFQMNANVNSISFSHDGSRMYSHGDDGEVFIWDLKARKCIQKFTDDGCLIGTSIDASSNNSFLACGSHSGVVNVYDINNVMSGKFEPLKIFYNLVTPITNVKFNSTSEILCISSGHKEKAVKLIHLPSMSVFSNFPVTPSKLHTVTCVDFSPNSGYMALGDAKKLAHLYRLKYYGNY